MNKKTLALTEEQYIDIITTMRTGFSGCRPNHRAATALVLEGNLGLRVSDIVQLKLNNIIKDGNRYRLNIVEQKTGKTRTFSVPMEIYSYIQGYCIDNGIKPDEVIFPIGERSIQKQLKMVCDYLDYPGISTHSFRKYFATRIYEENGYNVVLVQQLLQHSSPAVTQRYIGIQPKQIEEALNKHIKLL